MKLLDLFCGAGGCSVGYYRAGFTNIVGVDIKKQRHYPFNFIQENALSFLENIIKTGEIEEYDLIHASPPCQRFSAARTLSKKEHPDLLTPTLELLRSSSVNYVVENVPGAPLNANIVLCGLMFGLRVFRHRLFETRPIITTDMTCDHSKWKSAGSRLRRDGKRVKQSFEDVEILCVVGHDFKVSDARIAMGIDWMSRDELSQAIPPAYTEYIGKEILKIGFLPEKNFRSGS